MSDDIVKVEINGREIEARKGEMLIRVTDREGITVPRFCYHDKLSVAANCRMCLVEVEKAPKALPACATPVMDGMKVFTKSPRALAAQKAAMEFLLINHPLDCPICDQGGECELQDIALGFGGSVSQYTETKRVVKDKNLGPLISSDMTRCIHCTRCVRFGQEIAGIQELGATGRGEFMTIGTFIEKSVDHELSGNVIDLCPVGALNNKPFRFRARAWELSQAATVAAHDGVGSNVFVHRMRGKAMRAVPKANEAVNETWISDRDRYSHEGIYAVDRLPAPAVRGADGKWHERDWESALTTTVEQLRSATGGDFSRLGVLASPSATLEEHFLLAQLARKLGCGNVDHRLRQQDFSDAAGDPTWPSLGQDLDEFAANDAVLVVGAQLRKDAPLVAHRLRMAAMRGAKVAFVNARRGDYLFPVFAQQVVRPSQMARELAAILVATGRVPSDLAGPCSGIKPDAGHQAIAQSLSDANRATVLLGRGAFAHPQFAALRRLAAALAEATGAALSFLPDGGNAAGAWLAGMVPHRLPGGDKAPVAGEDVRAMIEHPKQAYILLGVEAEADFLDGPAALAALKQASAVVALTPFASTRMREYASIMLPVGTWLETAGTFVNAAGRQQRFNGAANPVGEARPAWKVLRVLGNLFGVDGFDYEDIDAVRGHIDEYIDGVSAGAPGVAAAVKLEQADDAGLELAAGFGLYDVDGVVRRAPALQLTRDAGADRCLRIHPTTAESLCLEDGGGAVLKLTSGSVLLPVAFDDGVPAGTAWVPTLGYGADCTVEAAS